MKWLNNTLLQAAHDFVTFDIFLLQLISKLFQL